MKDFRRLRARLFRQVSFYQRAQHFHRRFARGQMRNHVGRGQFHVIDPSGTAGSHERFLFAVFETVYKLRRFLHNRNVRAEIRGESQIARAEFPYRRRDFLRHIRARQHAKLFAYDMLRRRRELPDNVLVSGIAESVMDVGKPVPCRNRPGRAMPGALSATNAAAFRKRRRSMLQRGDRFPVFHGNREDVETLTPGAHFHAFSATDTLGNVPRNGKAGRVNGGFGVRRPRRFGRKEIFAKNRNRRRAKQGAYAAAQKFAPRHRLSAHCKTPVP